MRQYFWKDNQCTAKNAESPECICWHDDNTGPFADAINMPWLNWREKPETVKQTPEVEPPFTKNFVEAIRTMQHAVHENAKAHGWWDTPPEDGTVIMLIVRELSELLEELRVGGRESAKIDGFTSEEEELADAVIRILDFAGRKNYRLGQAILAKHAFNLTRPHKHGGKLF